MEIQAKKNRYYVPFQNVLPLFSVTDFINVEKIPYNSQGTFEWFVLITPCTSSKYF